MHSTREKLCAFVDGLPIVSTHEHHQDDEWHRDVSLEKILASSYVNWVEPPPATADGRARFLEKVGFNAYFVWLSRGLEKIYGVQPLNADNWDAVSDAIRAAHAGNPTHHIDIMRKHAGYRTAIQDSFWNYGYDSGHPEFFATTFRVDKYVVCHHPDVRDHDGGNPWGAGFQPESFDDYLELVRRDVVAAARKKGTVALKSAVAYSRPIAYGPAAREDAAKAFNRRTGEIEPRFARAFGDYVMDYICGLAGELGLPFQHHTGLGLVAGSNPLGLDYLVNKHPNVVFVLFHAGYPWVGEAAGMAHNYQNVMLDICWVPLISPTAAIRAVREFAEAGINGHRICWGGDCQSGEESVGAALAFRHVMAIALGQLVDEGYFGMGEAERYAIGLSHKNAERVYRLV